MVQFSNEMFQSAAYVQWFARERGKYVNIIMRGIAKYIKRILEAFLWRVQSSVDIFQCTLTFLMSVVFFGNFIAKTNTALNISVITPGMHAYSDNCNIVQGFAGYDETFALNEYTFLGFINTNMI
jgi:hypothetical protein